MVKDVVVSLETSTRTRLPTPNAREYRERTSPETKQDQARQRGTEKEAIDSERGRSREREELEVATDPDMISIMGFGGFGTTKGKHVSGSKGGSAKKKETTEYRQYMNRSKGFNRPLSPGK